MSTVNDKVETTFSPPGAVDSSDMQRRVSYVENDVVHVKSEVANLRERVEDMGDRLEVLEKEARALGESRSRVIEQIIMLIIGGVVSTVLANLLG